MKQSMQSIGANWLRDSGIGEASDTVVRAVACVLGSLRRSFESQKFLEVVIPVLEGMHESPFLESLELSIGKDFTTKSGIARRADRAQLSSVPGGYLQALLPRLGNVYTIARMFRGEILPNYLMEFHYVQANGKGGLEEALKLGLTLITDAVQALKDKGIAVSDRVQKFSRTPVRISYSEAVKQVGGRLGERFTHDQYCRLASANGDQPVIMMGVPLHVEPYAAIGARITHEGPAFFEIIVPDAGELGAGKEFESDIEAFWDHSGGSFARRLGLQWHESRDLAIIAELLAHSPSPSFSVGLGFERLTQYFLGTPDIAGAVAFPVLNGGSFRRPPVAELV